MSNTSRETNGGEEKGERRGGGGRERVRLREVKEERILLDSFA